MLVVVIGSYRKNELHEYNFKPDLEDFFKKTAEKIGQILANEKHQLWVSWSERNPDSQLGNKGKEGHPYDETADYHALNGYLKAIADNPQLIRQGAKVIIEISKAREREPKPFGKEIDFYEGIQGVEVIQRIESQNPKYRSRLLLEQAQSAEILIVIGGGKATLSTIQTAIDRKIILPLGFVGGSCSNEAIARMSPDIKQRLMTEITDLADLSDDKASDKIFVKLPRLIELIKSPHISPNPSTKEESPMASPPPNNDSNDNSSGDRLSFLSRLFQRPVNIVVGVVAVVILGGTWVLIGKPKLPGIIEPNRPEQPSSEKQKNIIQEEPQVNVNLRCAWKSKGRRNGAIITATATIYAENGTIIANSFGSTNTEGIISFKVKRLQKVRVAISHNDIRDSQPMIDIEVTESPEELKKLDYNVKRTNCNFDAK
jgi:hypothetical protein